MRVRHIVALSINQPSEIMEELFLIEQSPARGGAWWYDPELVMSLSTRRSNVNQVLWLHVSVNKVLGKYQIDFGNLCTIRRGNHK